MALFTLYVDTNDSSWMTQKPSDMTSFDVTQYQSANFVAASFILCTLWAAAVFANSLVCVVIQRSRRLQSTTNYFVVTLAVLDIALAVSCVPFVLGNYIAGRWIFGSVICRIVQFLKWIAPISTMYIFSSICIDRYYTILYPLSFKVTRGSAKRMIIGSLTAAVLLSSPSLYFYRVDVNQCIGTTGQSWAGMIYLVLICAISYFIPVIAMFSGYSRVFRYIWRTGNTGRAFQRTMNPVPLSKVKMVKLIIIVNLVIILLMLPLYISQIVHCMKSEPYINSVTNTSVFLIYFSSTVAKPLIYVMLNANFRRGCKEVFCMSAMKCYRSHAYTITAPSKLGKMNHVGTVRGEPDVELEMKRLESPTKTFNRSAVLKTAWPSDDNNCTNV